MKKLQFRITGIDKNTSELKSGEWTNADYQEVNGSDFKVTIQFAKNLMNIANDVENSWQMEFRTVDVTDITKHIEELQTKATDVKIYAGCEDGSAELALQNFIDKRTEIEKLIVGKSWMITTTKNRVIYGSDIQKLIVEVTTIDYGERIKKVEVFE